MKKHLVWIVSNGSTVQIWCSVELSPVFDVLCISHGTSVFFKEPAPVCVVVDAESIERGEVVLLKDFFCTKHNVPVVFVYRRLLNILNEDEGNSFFLLDSFSPGSLRNKIKKLLLKSNIYSPAFLEGNNSKSMEAFYKALEAASLSDDCVLLLGECGSGKSFAARLIHEKSKRAALPLVHINIAEINEGFIESSLFGTVRGAFTGATDRKGMLEEAQGSTLFIDEIAELPLRVQAKLLNCVENSMFRRVGSTKERAFNARLIFATNVDIGNYIEQGLFRKDLFYRINTICIKVPALREHKEDIPRLAKKFAFERNKQISCNAIEKLCSYYWPGNIRELKNSIMRASVFCKNKEIAADDVVFS